ncbi:hypothetical protein LCGC14_0331850 [marine sediment metagenome]|uniref:Uncharacterized protein n=1 Tax=marine sediment metagenome TaxID=412755 RepID=A0A0F9W3G8_9ZZZZ
MQRDRFYSYDSYDRRRDDRKESADPDVREDARILERLERQLTKRVFKISVKR